MNLDKVCIKVLSVLHDGDTEEQEIAAMIDWQDLSHPNEYIQYLLGNGLIHKVLRDATTDGEVGYDENTGTAYYQITVHGKAEFEHLRGRRIEKALDLAASLFPL